MQHLARPSGCSSPKSGTVCNKNYEQLLQKSLFLLKQDAGVANFEAIRDPIRTRDQTPDAMDR
jgi:hypothetical protein